MKLPLPPVRLLRDSLPPLLRLKFLSLSLAQLKLRLLRRPPPPLRQLKYPLL
jgi:hypothetical protein